MPGVWNLGPNLSLWAQGLRISPAAIFLVPECRAGIDIMVLAEISIRSLIQGVGAIVGNTKSKSLGLPLSSSSSCSIIPEGNAEK